MDYIIAETEFKDNAIAVDPPGCGCTDCIVGNSIPLDHEGRMEDVAKDFFNGRRVINRSSGDFAFAHAVDGDLKITFIHTFDGSVQSIVSMHSDSDSAPALFTCIPDYR